MRNGFEKRGLKNSDSGSKRRFLDKGSQFRLERFWALLEKVSF